MIDWQWIPGVLLAAGAAGHSLRLRRRLKAELQAQIDMETERGLIDAARQQAQHALMLWPRAWEGGRPLTQVEEVVQSGQGWLGTPLDPGEQQAQMQADTERLLASYEPPRDEEES